MEQLNPCTTTSEAHAPRVHAPQQEKQREACALQPVSSHCLPQLEKAHVKQWRLRAAKKKKNCFILKYRFSGTCSQSLWFRSGNVHLYNQLSSPIPPWCPQIHVRWFWHAISEDLIWESLWKGPWAHQLKLCIWEKPCDLREVHSPLWDFISVSIQWGKWSSDPFQDTYSRSSGIFTISQGCGCSESPRMGTNLQTELTLKGNSW